MSNDEMQSNKKSPDDINTVLPPYIAKNSLSAAFGSWWSIIGITTAGISIFNNLVRALGLDLRGFIEFIVNGYRIAFHGLFDSLFFGLFLLFPDLVIPLAIKDFFSLYLILGFTVARTLSGSFFAQKYSASFTISENSASSPSFYPMSVTIVSGRSGFKSRPKLIVWARYVIHTLATWPKIFLEAWRLPIFSVHTRDVPPGFYFSYGIPSTKSEKSATGRFVWDLRFVFVLQVTAITFVVVLVSIANSKVL
ncbi:MAG: hypothetical protein AAFV74_19975 [Pseudomonadota bacterium]